MAEILDFPSASERLKRKQRMERTYLQWNFANWITVLLMAGLGAVAIGVIVSGVKTYQAQGS